MRGRLLLAFAVVCISTGAPFARWAAPAEPIAIAGLRVGIASLLLLAAGWRELGELARIPKRDRPFVLLSGLLLAVHFGSWIASLSFTSTAASVALVCTNPVFAALFGRIFLGDRVATREVIGIGIQVTAGISALPADVSVMPGKTWIKPLTP